MDISHFHITIKSKVGMDFDPARDHHWEHQNTLPSCSLLLITSKQQNENIDLPCTPILIINICAMQYYNTETLNYWNVGNYNG